MNREQHYIKVICYKYGDSLSTHSLYFQFFYLAQSPVERSHSDGASCLVIRGSVCDMAMCGFRNSRTQLLCVWGGGGGGRMGWGVRGRGGGLRGLKPRLRVVA